MSDKNYAEYVDAVLHAVIEDQASMTITKDSKPVAVIVPYNQYQAMTQELGL